MLGFGPLASGPLASNEQGAGDGSTTGALQAGLATITGTAMRIGAVVPVTHTATGVLVALPATVMGGIQGRLGGFEYATGAKSTSRKPVYLRRLEQRAEAVETEPDAPVQDATEEIEKKAARMLLAKKGEQSLGPLMKKWLAEKPKMSRGADPRAAFLKRVRSRIAAMMDEDDSLIGLM